MAMHLMDNQPVLPDNYPVQRRNTSLPIGPASHGSAASDATPQQAHPYRSDLLQNPGGNILGEFQAHLPSLSPAHRPHMPDENGAQGVLWTYPPSRTAAAYPPNASIRVPSEVQTQLRNLLRFAPAESSIPYDVWQYLQIICDTSNDVYVATKTAPTPVQDHPIDDFIHDDTYATPSSNNPCTGSHHVPLHAPIPTSDATPLYATLDKPYSTFEEFQCGWEDCDIIITSTRFSAIEAHIKQFHFPENSAEPWIPSKRGICKWNGCTWHHNMYYRSFAKHIATQHLRSTAANCSDCGERFTRGDSRNRHAHLKHGQGRDPSLGEELHL